VLQKNWTELIKPKGLKVDPGDNPERSATITAEPLERGFGMTLGNAVRRVLLSSLQGAAVTSIQIEGVLHEFSSIPGVREDITDIVLNIKSIGLRMHGEGLKRMTLQAEGPGEVTAGMIETGHDIEIMDPDLVICALDNGAKLDMELTVESGRGRADRADPRRCHLQPGQEGHLSGRERPGRPGHRLRQAYPDGRDQWRRHARRRGRAGGPHPAGPAPALHQFR
jgi:DNA-directed RNA polymerase alpha subunit